MLKKTIEQLEEIHEQVKNKKTSMPEAIARITAIKHKIQAIALDWMYSRKAIEVTDLRRKLKSE